MMRSPGLDNSASIDQVIQRERGNSMGERGYQIGRAEISQDGSINRTQPLPSMTAASNYRSDYTNTSPPPVRKRDERHVLPRGYSNENSLSRRRSIRQDDDESSSGRSGRTATLNGSPGSAHGSSQFTGSKPANITDFFSPEVFRVVLHNPTTAHRLLRFCQSRACGENMEFLQKMEAYHRLIDEMTQLLGTVQTTYVSADAPRQLNLSHSEIKRVAGDIKEATKYTIPSLEMVFAGAQDQVEAIIANDIYPRFVKHQVTASATMALANHRERFQGLGDCFCLTDPRTADNPILYASDGFVHVTGYSRKDIIPRNCRFLQGPATDPGAPRRLRVAIDNCEETVELLLNYRKNGDPFWNLLYVAPLYNEKGEVAYFLGGQINCSTTIHTFTDVLKVLSINDDELDMLDSMGQSKAPSVKSQAVKTKSSFFKSWRKYHGSVDITPRIVVREEPGMEGELVEKLGRLTFKTQVEAFYTAYSKYVVLDYNSVMQTLLISHYSPGVIDMLCLNLPNGNVVPIYNKEIFKVLQDYASSSASSSRSKDFRNTVKEALRGGRAVSVETGLLTGFEEKKGGGGWFGGSGGDKEKIMRVEERYVTHWTPLKDEHGRVRHVVLTIAPKS